MIFSRLILRTIDNRQQLMHFSFYVLSLSCNFLSFRLYPCDVTLYLMSDCSLYGSLYGSLYDSLYGSPYGFMLPPPFWTALSRSPLMSSAWKNKPASYQTPLCHGPKKARYEMEIMFSDYVMSECCASALLPFPGGFQQVKVLMT